jgi:hypothetical protein
MPSPAVQVAGVFHDKEVVQAFLLPQYDGHVTADPAEVDAIRFEPFDEVRGRWTVSECHTTATPRPCLVSEPVFSPVLTILGLQQTLLLSVHERNGSVSETTPAFHQVAFALWPRVLWCVTLIAIWHDVHTGSAQVAGLP